MPWLAWFLLVVFVVIAVVGIRCVREALAMSNEWTVIVAKFTKPMEGSDAPDQKSE